MTNELPDTHPSPPAPVPLALKSNEGLGPDAEAVARWYCVSREGMATLCIDEEDARANAAHCDQAWRAESPHKAVRLVDAAEAERLRAALDAERKRVLVVVEQRLLTWRQRTMKKSGDRLALDDFMGQESIDDLIDFVCDEWA